MLLFLVLGGERLLVECRARLKAPCAAASPIRPSGGRRCSSNRQIARAPGVLCFFSYFSRISERRRFPLFGRKRSRLVRRVEGHPRAEVNLGLTLTRNSMLTCCCTGVSSTRMGAPMTMLQPNSDIDSASLSTFGLLLTGRLSLRNEILSALSVHTKSPFRNREEQREHEVW